MTRINSNVSRYRHNIFYCVNELRLEASGTSYLLLKVQLLPPYQYAAAVFEVEIGIFYKCQSEYQVVLVILQ